MDIKLKKILYKQIKPVISYSVLGVSLALSLFLGYVSLNSSLPFFSKERDQFSALIYPTNREEYRRLLLANRPEVIEEFILGEVKGKPNFDKNVSRYDDILLDAAKKYQVDCTLIKATMLAESRGNPKARSGVGAIGLMQLMPLTARAMGYASNLNDPRVNIMAGAKYMAHLKGKACYEKPRNEVCDVSVDIKFRLAAYNGGPKCNKPGGGSCANQATWECLYYDAYSQTRYYVDKVKANYQHLKKNNWGC